MSSRVDSDGCMAYSLVVVRMILFRGDILFKDIDWRGCGIEYQGWCCRGAECFIGYYEGWK